MIKHHEFIYFTKISLCYLTKMDLRLQYMISAREDLCVYFCGGGGIEGGGGSDH